MGGGTALPLSYSRSNPLPLFLCTLTAFFSSLSRASPPPPPPSITFFITFRPLLFLPPPTAPPVFLYRPCVPVCSSLKLFDRVYVGTRMRAYPRYSCLWTCIENDSGNNVAYFISKQSLAATRGHSRRASPLLLLTLVAPRQPNPRG